MTTSTGQAIEQAYADCEQITRREARNFYYGIRLLPPPKRAALSAVYALARRIDDIGDGDLPEGDKLVAWTRCAKGCPGRRRRRPGAGRGARRRPSLPPRPRRFR